MQDPVARQERLARLMEDSRAYDFRAALRLLECAWSDRPRIGEARQPHEEPVRFGQPPSLAFEGSMLGDWIAGVEGGAPRLEVHGFGLLGANGPMPLHLSEFIRDRVRNAGDPTMARFLDLFNHRMISLFYRAWASAQPTVSLDRGGESAEADRFTAYLASLLGLGMPSLRGRDSVPDYAKLHYAGLLGQQARNAEGLAQLLAGFFHVPVRVEEFIGHWMTLPADSLCRMRTGPEAPRLGASTILGRKVWNGQHKFRIVIGPVGFDDYRRLLPGGDSFRRLLDWVRLYAGLEYAWDVNVQLQREQVPPLRLGRQTRLGWTSWLCSKLPEHDDRQLVLNPLAQAAT